MIGSSEDEGPPPFRARVAERCLRAIASRRRGLLDIMLAVLFVLGREVPAAWRARRGFARAEARSEAGAGATGEGLLASGRAVGFHASHLIRHGMSGAEARYFGADLPRVLAVIDRVPLQVDLRWRARRRRAEIPALASKSAFAQACEDHDFPHPPTRAIDLDTPSIPAFDPFPGDAIVVKPDRGSGGRGVRVLGRTKEGGWVVGEGTASVGAGKAEEGIDLFTLLRRHYGAGRFVLQPLLINHPRLSCSIANTLTTFRVITCRRASGEVDVLSALAEIPLEEGFPVPPRIASRPVDLETGALLPVDLAYVPQPDPSQTVGPFGDSVVPGWGDVGPMTIAAHRALVPRGAREPATIGWDVAITPDGVVLLEGNAEWRPAPHILNAAGLNLGLGYRLFAALDGNDKE